MTHKIERHGGLQRREHDPVSTALRITPRPHYSHGHPKLFLHFLSIEPHTLVKLGLCYLMELNYSKHNILYPHSNTYFLQIVITPPANRSCHQKPKKFPPSEFGKQLLNVSCLFLDRIPTLLLNPNGECY